MDKEQYPESFLRGISNKDFISKDGYVLPSAFQFDDGLRNNGKKELSINWYDCEDALVTALEQKREDGRKQFSVGVAKLDLVRVKIFLGAFIENNTFFYERQELPENPYHGNLLIPENLSKPVRSLISSGLALVAGTNVTYQE